MIYVDVLLTIYYAPVGDCTNQSRWDAMGCDAWGWVMIGWTAVRWDAMRWDGWVALRWDAMGWIRCVGVGGTDLDVCVVSQHEEMYRRVGQR
jgi:hypothetical protein